MVTNHIGDIIIDEQIYDYISCPARYDMKAKGLIGKDYETVPSLLKQVARKFYTTLMNGEVLPPSTLKKQWDKLCERHSDFMVPKKVLEGMDKLMKLYRWAADEQLIIADVHVPYGILFQERDNAIDVRGTIPVIAVTKAGQMEILITDFGNRYPEQTKIDMNLSYTMMSYAFLKERGESIGIRIHNVKNNKDFYAYRMADDYKRLETAVKNTVYCIRQKLYYPRESVLCGICNARDICRGWHE